MNKQSFNKTDRKILGIAFALLFISTMLIWQNDWMYRLVQVNRGDHEQIGEIKIQNNDVRRRFEVALSWLPIRDGNKVYQGDSIFTGNNSSATIITKSGEEIYIAPNSLVVITQQKDSISLNIGFGSVKGTVEKGKNFFVTSNDRITEFSGNKAVVNIDAGEGNKLLLNVLSGEVSLKQKPGEILRASQEPIEIKERTPTPAQAIINKIQLLSPKSNAQFKFKADIPVIFNWKTDKKYARTKIKISLDSEFKSTIVSSRLEDNQYSAYNLPSDETIYWQVIAEGGQSDVFKFTLAGDSPPVPTSPATGYQFFYDPTLSQKILGYKIDLLWDAASVAHSFEVQIATDFNFAQNVTSYKTRNQVLSLGLLPSGNYYWRVRSDDYPGEKWSEPSYFKIGPEPTKILSAPLPQLADSIFLIPTKLHGESSDKIRGLRKIGSQKYIENFPNIVWSSVTGAEYYILQISKNNGFTDLVANETLTQRSYKLKDIEPGTYFWRIKGMSPKTRDGRFMRAQKINLAVAPPIALSQPLIVDEIPDPVLLKAPPPPQLLKWNPTVFTDEYEIEFSAKNDFSISKKFITTKSEQQIAMPLPGIYFWRIRSLDRFHVPVSPRSPSYTIEFQRIYKDPSLAGNLVALHPKPLDSIIIVGNKNSELEFKWNKPFKDVLYRLELAYEPTFESIFYSAQTINHSFKYQNRFSKKIIYWRVRAENEKFVSAWTDPNRFYVSYEGSSFDFENSEKMFSSRLKAQDRQNEELAAQRRRLTTLRSPASALLIQLDTPQFIQHLSQYTIVSNIDYRVDPTKLNQKKYRKYFEEALGNPTFNWSKVQAAEKYIFEIAKDSNFKNIIVKLPAWNNSFTWENAQPGRFYYRVQAFNERFKQSPYSETKLLDLSVSAPTPTSEGNFVESFIEPKELWHPPKPILLSWLPVIFARAYELEFSEKSDFKVTKVYKTLTSSQEIKILSTGVYYWRVRALNERGIAIGPFSSVRSAEVEQVSRTLASARTLLGLFPIQRTMIMVGDGIMNLAFHWLSASRQTDEVVEVSKSETFTDVISRVKGRKGKAILSDDLPEGQLFWRVKSSSGISKVNEFQLRRERMPYLTHPNDR